MTLIGKKKNLEQADAKLPQNVQQTKNSKNIMFAEIEVVEIIFKEKPDVYFILNFAENDKKFMLRSSSIQPYLNFYLNVFAVFDTFLA